ncbi:tRNA threonylcarbamoyladenosine dehydratase [Microbacter margulisiae]|uniref:tRNA A37 threonylcarbamoyladenosine dehydratase n=1 Tax=Microbacter margulisiae TaxID=1350067 RepID=A0A7W5DQ91_9PORP|nr:tRNA threonylcarbamoyladenosine dehydratase [Microbacter margulisiae]MBB3187090.1 tRNA A37 threonylcarbamoyladenosine dehydratase [Microbacter margulisiae]
MSLQEDIFHRTELLLGAKAMACLAEKKVIIFGIGGVGSWCAEALIRSGIIYLTIVDSDRVDVTNVNRQLHATTETLGELKTEVFKQRLLSINPDAQITAIANRYNASTSASFALNSYDVIIDAIDSLEDKMHLILEATHTSALFFSSMGAAWRLDPTRVRVAEFWKVQGCPLASSLRTRFRKQSLFPEKKFLAVYSDEHVIGPKDKITNEANSALKPAHRENGSVVYVTAVFGFTIASLVVKTLMSSV